MSAGKRVNQLTTTTFVLIVLAVEALLRPLLTPTYLPPTHKQQMCSRHYSVGADGVIFALPGKDGADYTMRIYNSDGPSPVFYRACCTERSVAGQHHPVPL